MFKVNFTSKYSVQFCWTKIIYQDFVTLVFCVLVVQISSDSCSSI